MSAPIAMVSGSTSHGFQISGLRHKLRCFLVSDRLRFRPLMFMFFVWRIWRSRRILRPLMTIHSDLLQRPPRTIIFHTISYHISYIISHLSYNIYHISYIYNIYNVYIYLYKCIIWLLDTANQDSNRPPPATWSRRARSLAARGHLVSATAVLRFWGVKLATWN